MIFKRINKDYVLRWPVTMDGEVRSLVGMDLKLTIRDPNNRDRIMVFSTAGNVVTADFPTALQPKCGIYHLTLWANYGKDGQTAVDSAHAFELVPDTGMENDGTDGIDTEIIDIPVGDMEIGIKGAKGNTGATFTPSVDENGVLSWKNESGLVNPAPVSILGPQGDPGEDGTSVTHHFEGSVLHMTSASGTTTADLRGPIGPRGFPGTINYPRFYIDKRMQLHMVTTSSADAARFKIVKGQLIITI